MVEQTGVVVACPHCGAHLQIGEIPPPMYQPQPDYSQPQYHPSNYPPPPQNYPYPNYPQQYPQYFAPQSADPSQQPSEQQFPTQQFPPAQFPQYQPATNQFEQIAAPSPPIPELRRPDPIVQTEIAPTQPFSPPPPVPVCAPQWEVSSAPQPPPALASSPLAETMDFTLPATLTAAAKQPESDAWLPKIDVSLPEPTKPVPPPEASAAVDAAPAIAPAETATISMPAIDLNPPPKVSPEPTPEPIVVRKSPPTEIWNSSQIPVPPPPEPTVTFTAAPTPAVAPTPVIFQAANVAPTPVVSQPAMVAQPLAPPTQEMSRDAVQLPDFSVFGSQATASAPAAAIPTLEITAGRDDFAAAGSATSQTSTGPSITTSNEPRPAVVSKQLFIIVASYASAITLGFIYLWLKMRNGNALDLPDRKPTFRNGQASLSLYPDGQLPASHRLKLG
ncbi:MAG: hypothetical protein JWM11_5584 [Planctomycetaceae bacterium]|nr:hypothetical protein [Planctomycetaceae bacterium]